MSKLNILLMFSIFASIALADGHRLGFDGCYQLYLPSVMYPAFCLQGTAEEGIGGRGVRLAVFHTNTQQVIHCQISSGSGMTETSFSFQSAQDQLVLENVRIEQGRRLGDAVIGKTRLKFVELDDRSTDRLLGIANSSCR